MADDIATKMRARGWRAHPTRGDGMAWLRWVNDGSRSHVMICTESCALQPPEPEPDKPPERWFVARHSNGGSSFFEVGAPDLDRCLALWDALPLPQEQKVLNEPYYDEMDILAMRDFLAKMES